ncbi:MAG: iron permease [Betaproteobacteria bacterium]|nr:iron permease [Betaproteobacteria bacterium]
MLSAAIIVFREVLEAALIIGIIAAATRGLPGRNRWLAVGVVVGAAGSALVAVMTGQISDLAEGTGQELFNAGILGIAALMLAWHNIWMARHGAQMAREAKQIGADVASGSREMSTLALVIALAVLREGSETALFLFGLATSGESPLAVAGGGLAGLLTGVAAGLALYAGILGIPARLFFAATSGLILLMACAMSSQAAQFLVQADLLPSLADPVWDTSWLLDMSSLTGRFLHTLVGYEASPSGIQLVFYLSTFIVILAGMRIFRFRPASSPST